MTETDSFEEIIYDAILSTCSYAHRRGNGPFNRNTCRGCMFGDPTMCQEDMQRDLVRRCKDVAFGINCKHGAIAGGSVKIGEVATFPGVKADKAQALKVLEEAAEVFGAWQAFKADKDGNTSAIFSLLDECADVIQAVANLIDAMGERDFAPYMDDCRERNEKRGRFDG